MIEFNSVTDFELLDQSKVEEWLNDVILNENKDIGDISYVFCNDEYLHKLNVDFLNHDTLTDIISFDYSEGDVVSGDVFISVERVVENAENFKVSFNEELSRVMVHGILHYCGYKDKTSDEAKVMRSKENFYLAKYI